MWREAAPSDRAGEAETIENGRIVIRNAAREDLLLPGICRRFESLQLLQRFEGAALAEQARFRREMVLMAVAWETPKRRAMSVGRASPSPVKRSAISSA